MKKIKLTISESLLINFKEYLEEQYYKKLTKFQRLQDFNFRLANYKYDLTSMETEIDCLAKQIKELKKILK